MFFVTLASERVALPNPPFSRHIMFTEITPLHDDDCFYIVKRDKEQFEYPMHIHPELEINFIENGDGALRVVGDSAEVLRKYDLVTVGPRLGHVWYQHECRSDDIHEITLQFMPEMLGNTLLQKSQMQSIARLMDRARRGIAFGQEAILRNYDALHALAETQPGFYRLLKFLELLYLLSREQDYRLLASPSFADVEQNPDNMRIVKVHEYVKEHFAEEIRLETAAALCFMSPSAFSRYFKLHTGRTFSEYIIETRLGIASRLLVDTTRPIQEICYECGFNNISNFNRTFKRKRGFTPGEFCDFYRTTIKRPASESSDF